jgi:hypothetical protein
MRMVLGKQPAVSRFESFPTFGIIREKLFAVH